MEAIEILKKAIDLRKDLGALVGSDQQSLCVSRVQCFIEIEFVGTHEDAWKVAEQLRAEKLPLDVEIESNSYASCLRLKVR